MEMETKWNYTSGLSNVEFTRKSCKYLHSRKVSQFEQSRSNRHDIMDLNMDLIREP